MKTQNLVQMIGGIIAALAILAGVLVGYGMLKQEVTDQRELLDLEVGNIHKKLEHETARRESFEERVLEYMLDDLKRDAPDIIGH